MAPEPRLVVAQRKREVPDILKRVRAAAPLHDVLVQRREAGERALGRRLRSAVELRGIGKPAFRFRRLAAVDVVAHAGADPFRLRSDEFARGEDDAVKRTAVLVVGGVKELFVDHVAELGGEAEEREDVRCGGCWRHRSNGGMRKRVKIKW